MDNSYIADRATIDYVREVAANHSIPTQVGFTGGGNDGTAFIGNGATNMPLSWPGRSSHSPAEIMDLRDLESLVDLIVALVED
jgi:putative aminopeptidase FrvX